MKIKRNDLYHMSKYSDYIMECNQFVIHVYEASIYLFQGSAHFFTWSMKKMRPHFEDETLRIINEICLTQFKFDEDKNEQS